MDSTVPGRSSSGDPDVGAGIITVVIRELLPPDTGRAYEAMLELRPRLGSREAFVEQVDARQRPAGYRLVAAVDGDDGPAAAVGGFRVVDNLAWGRHLYVDDLSTVPRERRQGHARAVLEWLVEEAGWQGCGQVHLDSGVGADREAAHRLYFASGFRISSHHFSRDL
jgi:GNAT superfamily N-acetyltransferase